VTISSMEAEYIAMFRSAKLLAMLGMIWVSFANMRDKPRLYCDNTDTVKNAARQKLFPLLIGFGSSHALFHFASAVDQSRLLLLFPGGISEIKKT